MKAARTDILAALRRHAPAAIPESEPAPRSPVHGDLAAGFAEALATAGGTCRRAADSDAVGRALRETPAFGAAARRESGVAGIEGCGRLDPDAPPHALADLDVAVLPGVLGVAESGAVWVEPRGLGERAALFLAQHVVLIVPGEALVADLHDAYARISAPLPRFGCFVAGPSKTADIEQALVIGAHGPRTLSVFLTGAPP